MDQDDECSQSDRFNKMQDDEEVRKMKWNEEWSEGRKWNRVVRGIVSAGIQSEIAGEHAR